MGAWALLWLPICAGWFILGMWAQHWRVQRKRVRPRFEYYGPG